MCPTSCRSTSKTSAEYGSFNEVLKEDGKHMIMITWTKRLLPVSPVVPDEITPRLGRGSQFGLEKLLQIFGLLPGDTETDLRQVRHRLG